MNLENLAAQLNLSLTINMHHTDDSRDWGSDDNKLHWNASDSEPKERYYKDCVWSVLYRLHKPINLSLVGLFL